MKAEDKKRISNSHSLKTLRNICKELWDADIWVYDNTNGPDIDSGNVQNPVCKLLLLENKGKESCCDNMKTSLKPLHKNRKELTFRCSSGLCVTALPLFENESNLGAIVCCGMWQPLHNGNLKKYKKRLTDMGFSNEDVERNYKKLKPANKQSLENLYSFMKLVANDLITYHQTLKEKEEIIKLQTTLIEKAYNSKHKAIISASRQMKRVFDTLELVENSEVPVLIDGESGTGKELLAATIHYNSPRRAKMFIAQNCSAFTNTILNSELFGHKKGAFTGAVADKKGIFEIADEGTLFLDEIADLTMDSQARILRVLETGTFYSTGGTELKTVNVRILTASNKNLQKQVEKGLFREDLLFRINTMHITLPPLREREDDIILLANYFIEKSSISHNKKPKEMSPELINILLDYRWPGNIRELKNAMERMVIVSANDDVLKPAHLPENIKTSHINTNEHTSGSITHTGFRESVEQFEKSFLEKTLGNADWDKKKACKTLKISHTTLYTKIKQYNLKDPGEAASN
ncbi:MAG: sigma 54-interacting transcriptional regulator [Candidatus Anammoxibacter sp.]